MWASSFLSVLHDLWRFLWRPESREASPIKIINLPVPVDQSVPSRLITLDTAKKTVVQLQVGTLYTAESVETVLVRSQLKAYDEHLVQSGNLTLIEWLLYKIHLQNKTIALLALRMSPLGLWHQTVKGLPDVRVGIEPTTSALMEWFDQSRSGQVGIIERVSPELTITVHSISDIPSGTYQEQVLTAAAWKELGPVFTRFRL